MALQNAGPPRRPPWVELHETKPRAVKIIISEGFRFEVGLCGDGTVLKYPSPYEDATAEALRHEQKIYEILGRHERIIRYLGPYEGGIRLGHAKNGNLTQWIFEGLDTAPLQYRLKWAKQIAEGLVHLHHNHVTHGDLCCRNVLLDKDLNVKLCDFEFSSLPEDHTDSSVEEDLYHLGSMIFEVITGKNPWTEPMEVPHGGLEDIFQQNQYPGLSRACKEVITKCWKKLYHSAEEAVNDLKAVTDAFTYGE